MFVLPLYEVLLVPGVNMYVRGEEFEEFALSKAVLILRRRSTFMRSDG